MIRLLKRKARLLVLDDDTSIQKLVAALLRRAGYAVDIVSSGSQAIERIGKQKYDVLLLDVMTPTDGGFTVIKHLKEADPALLKRVVLLTASPDSLLRGMKGDIYGVVRKPFEAAELVATIARVIAQ
ncbi:MAG TPA: response regulator [Thermoanaerobaculia bacterium]|jgi:CheY-like chemotaxis protein|nr:response regulator [Thermoanaerobaculia bacterium]